MGSVTRLVGLLFSVICLLVWCLALVCLGLLLDLLYLWLWCFTGGDAGIVVACFLLDFLLIDLRVCWFGLLRLACGLLWLFVC